ncbi:uncharacterized protein METZ01_LOCUS65687 [marine metagenome]|uniref:Uncharacterized protein n=1 Tax=marine metagenome TaxID=408172 RepID=A0A381TFX6_9ZZZZ
MRKRFECITDIASLVNVTLSEKPLDRPGHFYHPPNYPEQRNDVNATNPSVFN